MESVWVGKFNLDMSDFLVKWRKRMSNIEMTQVVVKRNSLEHQAIQDLQLFQCFGENMQGIKGVSKLPRWVKNSWNGF